MPLSMREWVYVGLRALGILGFAVFIGFYPLSSPATYDSSPSSSAISAPLTGNYGTTYVAMNTSKPIHSGQHLQGNITLPNYKTSTLQVSDCSQQLQPYAQAPVPSLFVMTSDQHSQWVVSLAGGGQQPTDPKSYVELQRCFVYNTQTQTLLLNFDFIAQTDTYYWFIVSVQSGYGSSPQGTYGVTGYVPPLTPKLNANIVIPSSINWQNVAGWMMGIAAVAGVGMDLYRKRWRIKSA